MNRPSTQSNDDAVREYIDQASSASPTRSDRRPLVISSVLLVVGAIVSVAATFMPWNVDGSLFGDEVWNGWQQIAVNLDAGRIYGVTMTLAFVLAFVGAILCLVAAIVGIIGRTTLAWAAITGLVLILLGTLGTFLGYFFLGALDETAAGAWVFTFSWIPTLLGVVGHVGRRY